MEQITVENDFGKVLSGVSFLTGNAESVCNTRKVPPLVPFFEKTVLFIDDFSRLLLKSKEAKQYSDVITLAFWCRKASILQLKERFLSDDNIVIGRGIAFHIAPSNVPVNFAYSLISGLLCGNANIVRVPSKDFPQVKIIVDALNEVLKQYTQFNEYIYLVRYGREKNINDLFSSFCDVRIVWGGDSTVNELRKSPMNARATEVNFADRFSLSVIDSEKYLLLENKSGFAENFYNDTYLTDQNACTSPRLVVWTGSKKDDAKALFWKNLHNIVSEKYTFQPIMGINKLTNAYIFAVNNNAKIIKSEDNLITRIEVSKLFENLMNYKDNSGFFFEYDCNDLSELKIICNDVACQTIGYLGDKEDVLNLVYSGIKGIDRVVPIGKTMDFDLIWDGYNLFERLTRIVDIKI